ncbi:MAG TPA: 50S ribosomal protein L30 [Sulfolobales archaeon]|nr:50S ribosomal protein L30 [Sulfolobales archaeon]
MALLAIIRLRGRVDVPPDVEKTLELLRLYRKFHATIYPDSLPGIVGMLRRAAMWITWGEISYETLLELLKKRGRAPGNKRLTDDYIARVTNNKYKSIEELATAIYRGEEMLHKIDNIVKPIFRLHPPSGGFKGSIKKPYGNDGELGYRGQDINDLIRRMI